MHLVILPPRFRKEQNRAAELNDPCTAACPEVYFR